MAMAMVSVISLNDALARVHVALMLTLKGAPFLFNGEEIGMADLELTTLDQLRDTAAISQYQIMTTRLGVAAQEALQAVIAATRDRCRSPLQWSGETNAGFSPPNIQPWLPVHPNHADGVSVAAQDGDATSMLSFYRRMLHLRRATPALIVGEYNALQW